MATPKWKPAGNEENMLPWLGPNNEYARPKPVPGSAEFLNDLIDSSGKCRHVAANMRSARSLNPTKIPRYLGFFTEAASEDASKIEYDTMRTSEVQELEPVFHQTQGPLRHPISRLDTDKICPDCFKEAVPEGFATWSLEYNNKTKRYGPMPPQIDAGQPITAERYLDDRPHFFASIASRPIFAQMAHDRRPFYVDTLHAPPWDPTINDDTEEGKQKMREQNIRINKANGPAYEGAAVVYRADGNFGYGQNSTAEHRVAHHRGSLRNPPPWPGNSSEPYTPPSKANRGFHRATPRPYREPPKPRDPQRPSMSEFLAGLPPGVRQELSDLTDNGDGRWPEPIPRRQLTLARVDSKEKLLTGRTHPSTPSEEEKSRWQLEAKKREVYAARSEAVTRDERLRKYNRIMIDNGYPEEYLQKPEATPQDDYDSMNNPFDPDPDRIPFRSITRPMDSMAEIAERHVAGRHFDRPFLLPHLNDIGDMKSIGYHPIADSYHSRGGPRSKQSNVSGSSQFQVPEAPSWSRVSNNGTSSSQRGSERQASSSKNAGSSSHQTVTPRVGSLGEIASSQPRLFTSSHHSNHGYGGLQRQPPTPSEIRPDDSISNIGTRRYQSTPTTQDHNRSDPARTSQNQSRASTGAASRLSSVPEGSSTRTSQSRGAASQTDTMVRGSTTTSPPARALLNSPQSSRRAAQSSNEYSSRSDTNSRRHQADARCNAPSHQTSSRSENSSRGLSQPSRDSASRSDVASQAVEDRTRTSTRESNAGGYTSRQSTTSDRRSENSSSRVSESQYSSSGNRSRYSRDGE